MKYVCSLPVNDNVDTVMFRLVICTFTLFDYNCLNLLT